MVDILLFSESKCDVFIQDHVDFHFLMIDLFFTTDTVVTVKLFMVILNCTYSQSFREQTVDFRRL